MSRPFLIGKILHSPRRLQAVFLAVTVLPTLVLVWFGWNWFALERDREDRQFDEERKRTVGLIGASLQQSLAADAQRLSDPAAWKDLTVEDARIVVIRPGGVDGFEIHPQSPLAYYPYRDALPEAPDSAFRSGEEEERRLKNYPRAIDNYRALARSADSAVRVGAKLRLARSLRLARRLTEALDVYTELSRESGVAAGIPGVPADLEARRLRCVLLEQLNRTVELRDEAERLLTDLRQPLWRLDGVNYELYTRQAATWVEPSQAWGSAPSESEALADAVRRLWSHWQTIGTRSEATADLRATSGEPGADLLAESRRILIWRRDGDRLVALVAGPRYLEQRWLAPLDSLLVSQRVRVALEDDAGQTVFGERFATDVPITRQSATDSSLPGVVAIGSANPQAERAERVYRERILLAGLALVMFAVTAGSYAVSRAVRRELDVARLQSDFVAAVSHEFRTPLTSLTQATDLLADGRVLDPARVPAYYAAQARATQRLRRLVETLLDLGRIEADTYPYRMQEVDVLALSQSVVDQFQEGALPDFRIELTTHGEAYAIVADADAIAMALRNLIENAVKYSGAAGSVRVELAPSGRKMTIAVRDQGPGIPRAEQKRIFRKFVRGAASTNNGIKGTGVGLAIVQQIVRAHSGRIRLKSAPGRGSTFTIVLPMMRR